MSSAEPQLFDFRNAGTSDTVVRMLREWIRKTADTFSDSWEAVSDSIVNLSCKSILSRTFDEGVKTVPLASVGFGMMVGEKPVPTLACIAIKDLSSLIGAIFGTELGETQDRKLTNIEISLCEMIFETCGSSLSAAWFGQDPLRIELGEFEDPPQFSRLIALNELVLCTQIELAVSQTVANLTWLVPRQELEVLMEQTTGMSLRKSLNDPRNIVQTIAIELIGVLGQANLTMESISDLEPGDLMLLDQKIDRPIPVLVDNQVFFEGWPGRIGKCQGIEISRVA